MKKIILVLGAALVVGLGIVAFSSLFVVFQSQQALVLQFGNPERIEKTPGLKVKLPFVQNVEYFEKRLLDLDPQPTEIILRDQKRISVDSFARYRIVDPLEFRKTARSVRNFRQLFGARLNSAVRDAVGKVLLADMLSEKRLEVMSEITDTLRSQEGEFGVKVVDVRIGRTDLPIDTSTAVYNRMRSDRMAKAAEIRAEGERQKLKIQAEAERQRTVIIAVATKESDILRGQGEGARTRILNDAYGRDPEFFQFYRSLQAYGEALGDGTTMVLAPDSDFFKYFKDIAGPGKQKQ